MPALKNPRHEAFAQAIHASLSKHGHKHIGNGHAYLEAGYRTTLEGARRSASRLLTFVDGIGERVAELQQQANARLEPKLDISRERIGRRLDKASRMAESQGKAGEMATCELGMAKVFHSTIEQEQNPTDFKSAKTMYDIGKRLLQSVGLASPDDASIQQAIEANDTFVDTLQAIKQRAQGLMIKHDD